ncbi:hypothetical protein TNCV_2645511 [Trichonephila clavipes]|nr:hypothetical protein TNCV_2645511 [Trichonephila clavipes]
MPLEETGLHFRSHLRCYLLRSNMECFTNTELANMYLIYGLEEGIARIAERLYRKRYPQRDARTTGCHNLCEYGSLRDNWHSVPHGLLLKSDSLRWPLPSFKVCPNNPGTCIDMIDQRQISGRPRSSKLNTDQSSCGENSLKSTQ